MSQDKNSTNDEGVRIRTAAYATEPRDVIVSFRITRSLSERIDNYQTGRRKRRRTDAIIDLLESSLYIMDRANQLDDPEVVKYLRDNLYNIQLVDDIMSWPPDRIEAIIGALVSERDRRISLRL